MCLHTSRFFTILHSSTQDSEQFTETGCWCLFSFIYCIKYLPSSRRRTAELVDKVSAELIDEVFNELTEEVSVEWTDEVPTELADEVSVI
jgi:hypothetical protein